MFKWLKLSQHHHSGKLRPHEHTSYAPLCILLIFVGFFLSAYTAFAEDHPAPQSGSIGLTGIMPGKPPTVAAVITDPINEQRFSSSPVTISGTCPDDVLVEIFKNDIFGGSTPCGSDNKFTLSMDLLIGKNTLIARVYDSLNQTGPDSSPVTVYYDALPAQTDPLNTGGFGNNQLLLTTDAVYRGTFPGQNLTISVGIISGTPPYAINILWGDATNTVVSRNDNSGFTASHVYAKAGTYQISIQASDAAGRVAFISVAAIVNGQPDTSAVASTDSSGNTTIVNRLLILWPLYVSSVAVVISFWLGERREKRVLKAHGLLLSN